jgi:hypothetical protein
LASIAWPSACTTARKEEEDLTLEQYPCLRCDGVLPRYVEGTALRDARRIDVTE